MLIAQALTPDYFLESIERGAEAYIPKEKMNEIGTYISDLLKAKEGIERPGKWFSRLESFLSEWLKGYREVKNKGKERLGYRLDHFEWCGTGKIIGIVDSNVYL